MRRSFLSPVDGALLPAYAAVATGLGYVTGQDLNWDLLNYHFYNPYQLIGGRLDRDIHVAGIQSFHNPLLDLPFYAAARLGVPPMAFFLLLSAFHGVALWTVHRVAMLLVPAAHASLGHAAGMGAAAVACTGAGFRSVIGSTMHDTTVAVPLLIALLLALRAVADRPRADVGAMPGLLVSGVLAGLAVGAKFAVGPVAVALAIVVASIPGPTAARGARLLRFTAGGALGVATSAGYWMWLMTRHFDSPVFPYFNNVFQSPFAPLVGLHDDRFFPTTVPQWLFFPFFWIKTQNLAMEPLFRDARLAVAFVTTLGIALAAARPRRAQPTTLDVSLIRLRLLAVWFAAAYLVWLVLFAYYRYVIALELLSGALVIGAAAVLLGRWRGAGAVALAVCLVLMTATRPPDWGRRAWSDSYFGIDAAALARYEGATIFMWDMPQGYVVPYFPASATFLRLLSNRGLVAGTEMWARLERRARSASSDRLFLLDLEPGIVHEQQAAALARLGLAMTAECESYGSHAGPFRVCRVERRSPSS